MNKENTTRSLSPKYGVGDVLLILDNTTDERFVGIVNEINITRRGIGYVVVCGPAKTKFNLFDRDEYYDDDMDGEPCYNILKWTGNVDVPLNFLMKV